MKEINYKKNDFQGMNQRQDFTKIPVNASPFILNATLSKPGSVLKRGGLDLYSTTQAGIGIQGGIDYETISDTHSLRIIRNGSIEVYNDTTDTFSVTALNVFNTSSKVESALFNNKAYHISLNDNLCYETGGSVTVVGAGGDEIKGGTIAVAQQALFVGQILGHEDRVYYSLYDSANNIPSHQFWNDSEGNLASSTRFYSLLRKNTCLYSFGLTGLCYAFTTEECFELDLERSSNVFGIRKIFDIGCANQRSITTCNGAMIWMDTRGRIWKWAGVGAPFPVSWDIEDDTIKKALINCIDKTNINNVCAGSLNNEFRFSIGNINNFNKNLTNVCIKGLLTQGIDRALWSIDTYPYKPTAFIKYKQDSENKLLMAVNGVNNIYEMDTNTYSDDGVAIDFFYATNFMDFDFPIHTKSGEELFVEFSPQPTETNYLNISYAINGRLEYTDMSSPDATIPVISHGVINMYSSDYLNSTNEIKKIRFPNEVRFRLLSLGFGNNQLNEGCEIIAIEMRLLALDILDITFDSIPLTDE